jgi:carboxynorspermidine decarboxylase
MNLDNINTPIYICEEKLLENNLKKLDYIQQKTGAKILLALKGFALWKSFDLVSKYLHGCCASGLNEAKLAKEFGREVHTYSPAFKPNEIEEVCKISNHVVFNSTNQLKLYKELAKSNDNSIGLRINPQVSTVTTELYNPCGFGSRLGTTIKNFDESFLDDIDGFHFHALCEQNSDDLAKVLQGFEEKFGKYFHKLKWINFGGGHHITRVDYDVELLINLINEFRSRYNNIPVYLEPGEAVGWQTGVLVASVLDIVDNGIKNIILDTSCEAHMPDVLAMPYRPDVRNADKPNVKKNTYRLTGNTCLAGDIIGDYSFDKEVQIGDKIIFEDMIHYTMVKNTTFNGINLPSIGYLRVDGSIEIFKEFAYEDFKGRLS